MAFHITRREETAFKTMKGGLEKDNHPIAREYLRRFPSDSDLYKQVLQKKANSHTNLHRKFASTTQLNNPSSVQEHENCRDFKYEETLTNELNKFYRDQVKQKKTEILRNKRLAFSVVFKVLVNAQIISDRFTVGDILREGANYGEMRENRSDWYEFGVPIYLENNQNFYLHRAEENGFVRLQLEDSSTWKDCQDADGFLSASLVRSKLQLTMQNALKNLKSNIEGGKDEFPRGVLSADIFCEGSTVALKLNKGDIVVDLVPTLAIPKTCLEWCQQFAMGAPPSHVIAKPCRFPLSDPETLWELSFLFAEKKRISSLGSAKYHLLLIFAEIRERDKTLSQLSFYHIQTILFHVADKLKDPMKWRSETSGDRFLDILRCLETCLQNRNCPHYFMPGTNLFSFMNVVSTSILKDRVRRMVRPSCVACNMAAIFRNNRGLNFSH